MINFIISGRGENQRFQRNWKLLSKICSCNNNRRWGDGKKIFVCDIFEIVHCLCFINWWPFIWWEMKMDTTFNAKSMILDSMMWIAGNKMKKIDNIVIIFWLSWSVNCVTFIVFCSKKIKWLPSKWKWLFIHLQRVLYAQNQLACCAKWLKCLIWSEEEIIIIDFDVLWRILKCHLSDSSATAGVHL